MDNELIEISNLLHEFLLFFNNLNPAIIQKTSEYKSFINGGNQIEHNQLQPFSPNSCKTLFSIIFRLGIYTEKLQMSPTLTKDKQFVLDLLNDLFDVNKNLSICNLIGTYGYIVQKRKIQTSVINLLQVLNGKCNILIKDDTIPVFIKNIEIKKNTSNLQDIFENYLFRNYINALRNNLLANPTLNKRAANKNRRNNINAANYIDKNGNKLNKQQLMFDINRYMNDNDDDNGNKYNDNYDDFNLQNKGNKFMNYNNNFSYDSKLKIDESTWLKLHTLITTQNTNKCIEFIPDYHEFFINKSHIFTKAGTDKFKLSQIFDKVFVRSSFIGNVIAFNENKNLFQFIPLKLGSNFTT